MLCAQRGAPSTDDCLYLNVYRPRGMHGELPVMFYIHRSSDAPYIFDRDGLVQPDAPPFDSAQLGLGRELRQAIGAFLRTGDPSLPAGPSWPAYEPETDLVMLLQPSGLNVTPAYEELHHCDFWASVPPPVF